MDSLGCFPCIYHSLFTHWFTDHWPSSPRAFLLITNYILVGCNLCVTNKKYFSHSCNGCFFCQLGKFCLLDIYILLKGWKLTESNFYYFAFTCHLQFISIKWMFYLGHTEMEKDSMKAVYSEVTARIGTSVASLFWYLYLL